MITYVSSTGHGYAIELSNAHTNTTVDWNTAKNNVNNKASVPNCTRWELPDSQNWINSITNHENKGCDGPPDFLAKYTATGFTAPLLDEKYFFRVAGPYDAPTCWKISSDYNLSILVDDTNSAHVLYALVF